MYPWEKAGPTPELPESDETEAFPWAVAASEAEAGYEEPAVAFSPEEERLVAEIAAHSPEILNAPLSFAYSEPEQADWRPLALVVAGAVAVGALAVFLLRPPESPPAPVVARAIPGRVAPESLPAKATPTPPAGSLIRPANTKALVSRTLEDGGRANPFRDAFPPPPLPTVEVIPAAVKPKPLPPPPPPTPVFGLVSVAVSGSNRAAMIQVSGLESTPSLHEVVVGDQVEGWAIKEISAQRVLLARGNKTQSLSAQ